MLTLIKSKNEERKYDEALELGLKAMKWCSERQIVFDTAISAYYLEKYTIAFELIEKYSLEYNVTDIQLRQGRQIQEKCIPHMRKTFNPIDVNVDLEGPITFTITTCKRLDLFKRTMNSFLNCVQDKQLISRWICVDDNSSEDDRKQMKSLYPFFEFYFKLPEEKGHAKSMNIIRKLVKTPYYFHMEDDFEMFHSDTYLYRCLDILSSDQEIGQVLLNLNYAETEKESQLFGGELKRTDQFQPYYLHVQRQTNNFSCEYWPHFSLRPSLLRTQILDIGEFSETADHFEMEYANRYITKWKSAFLTTVYSIHIGRLVSERGSEQKNAYDMNGQDQFVKKEHLYVINLDRREDRWKTFCSQDLSSFHVHRVSAVDGKTLKINEQLIRIFDENDYGWRSGMIGCALSHFLQIIELLNGDDEYRIILEDDAVLKPGFASSLKLVLKEKPWDILYLGHYPRKEIPSTLRTVQKKTNDSINYSFGGTVGYVITKTGAEKFLNFVQEHGMIHAIDTMQQISADKVNVYYVEPLLIQGECWDQNQHVDTDIQRDFHRLTVESGMSRVQGHCLYYKNRKFPISTYSGIFDDDWKRDEILVCQKQKIPTIAGLMIYNVDQTTFVVPDTLMIREIDVETVQPYKFKRRENEKFVWKIQL